MSKQTKEYAKKLVAQMTVEEKMSQMLYESPAIERLNIPAYNWWNEALHGVARAGVATVFPQSIGLAATFDPELVGQMGMWYRRKAAQNLTSFHGEEITESTKG